MNLMKNDYFYSYKQIWKVAYPILLSLIMEQMIGMTDTAFLGRVGEIELGASAIAGVFYLVIYMVGFGFSVGAQIIIARRNGEYRYDQTGNIFYHGLFFLLAVAFIIIGCSEAFAPSILGMTVNSNAIAAAAGSYVTYRLPGLVFAYMTAMFRAFYIGTTQTKTLTLNSIIMVLSNVCFNWVLIFGKLGIEPMGIKGAAIGSSLAELVSLIFFILYTLNKTDIVKYGLNHFSKFSFKTLGEILSVSIWTMIANVVSLSTWLIFFVSIEHLGERHLAVSNIIRSLSGLLWMVLMAFATTGSSLVSNLIGNGHPDSVKGLTIRIMKMSYAAIAVMILIMLSFPTAVISIYTDIPDLINASIPALFVLCASYIVTVPANVFCQAVAGTGSTNITFTMEIISLAIYMAYCFVVINLMHLSVAACWTAEFAYGIPMMLLCGWYLLSGRWKGKAI